MHRNLIENIILGITIGLGVVIVRLFTVNTGYNPWILLGVVAILLSLLQIIFIVLRKRSGTVSRLNPQEMKKPSSSQNGVAVSSAAQQTHSSDVFARELDHNWTGLETTDDHVLPSPHISDKSSSSDIDTPTTDKVLEQEYPRPYS
ncbi:MAG: hypothetical protein AAGF95_02400 [Chloroflexota bacterium]